MIRHSLSGGVQRWRYCEVAAKPARVLALKRPLSSGHLLTRKRLTGHRHTTSSVECSQVSHAARIAPRLIQNIFRAALARLLLLLTPAKQAVRHLPRLVRHIWPLGPLSLVLVFLGLAGAGLARMRGKIVANVRACTCCYGYGIQRCSLCSGRGMVGWEGKWSHKEPCPMCLGRRFVDCQACGGRFHRPLFRHCQTTALTLLKEIEVAERDASMDRIILTD